jgi:hypothetical protein
MNSTDMHWDQLLDRKISPEFVPPVRGHNPDLIKEDKYGFRPFETRCPGSNFEQTKVPVILTPTYSYEVDEESKMPTSTHSSVGSGSGGNSGGSTAAAPLSSVVSLAEPTPMTASNATAIFDNFFHISDELRDKLPDAFF